MPDGADSLADHWVRRTLPWVDPHLAACRFADAPVLALLDSTGPVHAAARHAYLCLDASDVLIVTAGRVVFNGHPCPMPALDMIDRMLGPPVPLPATTGAPFQGGLVGYIGYEFGAALHGVRHHPPAPDDPPDLFMARTRLVAAFDRAARTLTLHARGVPAGRIDQVAARLAAPAAAPTPTPLPPLTFQPAWTPAGYTARLARLLDYIHAGDIFQANLTMPHVSPRPPGLTGAAVQAALRTRNPAPFGAWLRCHGYDLCCSSPERFLSLDASGRIEARPIKGTAARTTDPTEDAKARSQLQASAKDRAENVMIVDVLRHDIGRQATIGSVQVPALCAVESFATVHHLVSQITGQLAPGSRATRLLAAALPGGSITGAPKHRAMQIIAELEGARRGPYCGCVLWLGWDGAMDSNIVIRSLSLTPQRIIAQAGGGIVAESDAAAEYAEMMLKVAPLLDIFGPPA